ncbi:MAG: ferrous iron transport protein B [Planctomycetaceae bacterium]|jgi:ferrous iron transport protein B|nr:ferrous iron transport protein B [Planctomycetaceae bacterium]
MDEHNEILAALVGQPNSGKSTVFNYLTGLHQTVANYPGVTVVKKSGHYHDGKRHIEVVDLPGTYSLTSYSQEERVTRDFLLLERPEVVVIVIDASNLRRHLYFVFQLLELQIPLVICLNMMDIAHRRGFSIDIAELEKVLGVPVIPANGRTGEGLEELRRQINIISAKHDHESPVTWKVNYGALEPLIEEFDKILSQKEPLVQDFPTRWLAVKLLENDREARRIIQHHTHDKDWEPLLESCVKKVEDYEKQSGDSPRKTIASSRNTLAETIEKQTVQRTFVPHRNSDTLDLILCHPFLGLISVAAVMFITFQLAFNLADGWTWFPWINEAGVFEWNTPLGVVDSIFSIWIPALLDSCFHLPEGDLHSLIYDGVIAGIGGVLTFVPTIFFIFLFISILEQSGYIARVVVVLDRLMRFFGLHGQSILPMILGGGIVGGCALPAVMATRSMREQRERILTIMVVPLMNCGAKVPVFALLISAFFLEYQGLILAAIILISWTIALIVASVLGKLFIGGEPSPLVIELPTYQVPGLRDMLFTAGLQSWWFVKKAGTIILAVNVFLWVLMYYPRPADPNTDAATQLANSYAAQMGRVFEPASQYAGFDWRDNVALIGGFAAKEVIVSTMATMYGIETENENDEEDNENSTNETEIENDINGIGSVDKPEEENILKEPVDVQGKGLTMELEEIKTDNLDIQGKRLAIRLRAEAGWTPLKAFVFILFVMIYNPCLATCAVIWRETGHIKYMLMTMAYTNGLAFLVAVMVYQLALFLTGHL